MSLLVFRRTEKKYLLNAEQYRALTALILAELLPDRYAKSTVVSLYLDTPDRRMIRASMAARSYKEKLRLRAYGIPQGDDPVFLEIKKKYNGTVYKRREEMPLDAAMRYLTDHIPPRDTQIMREIDYARRIWQDPVPAMLIAYERDAYTVRGMPEVRVTFDSHIRYRDEDLLLEHGHGGAPILSEGDVLMEIKANGAMPLFLAHALDQLGIYPTSFSKYGRAYMMQLNQKSKGELCHV